MGADQQVAAGQQVRIPVTVASGEKGITGFNAYDMTFTYDPAALTLNTKTSDAANLTVEDNNGTVRVPPLWRYSGFGRGSGSGIHRQGDCHLHREADQRQI